MDGTAGMQQMGGEATAGGRRRRQAAAAARWQAAPGRSDDATGAGLVGWKHPGSAQPSTSAHGTHSGPPTLSALRNRPSCWRQNARLSSSCRRSPPAAGSAASSALTSSAHFWPSSRPWSDPIAMRAHCKLPTRRAGEQAWPWRHGPGVREQGCSRRPATERIGHCILRSNRGICLPTERRPASGSRHPSPRSQPRRRLQPCRTMWRRAGSPSCAAACRRRAGWPSLGALTGAQGLPWLVIATAASMCFMLAARLPAAPPGRSCRPGCRYRRRRRRYGRCSRLSALPSSLAAQHR